MTLDEFLDDYVPNVLKPMGGWRVTNGGQIRRGSCCPLTAASGEDASAAGAEGRKLGINHSDRQGIIGAADFRAHPDRARLLAGLGLQEKA